MDSADALVLESDADYMTNPDNKLTRSEDDKMVAGVLGGVAQHFGFNVTWLRLLYVGATLISAGLPVLAYIAAAVIIPKQH